MIEDIEKALDFIRDSSNDFAKAKANRIHLEQFRKSKKALLMNQLKVLNIYAPHTLILTLNTLNYSKGTRQPSRKKSSLNGFCGRTIESRGLPYTAGLITGWLIGVIGNGSNKKNAC